jgi:hypothetical protein
LRYYIIAKTDLASGPNNSQPFVQHYIIYVAEKTKKVQDAFHSLWIEVSTEDRTSTEKFRATVNEKKLQHCRISKAV